MDGWILVLTLIVIGFILLLIELMFIPGFGLVGVLGLSALGYASYFAFTRFSAAAGTLIVIGSLGIIFALLKILPHTGVWKGLLLEKSQTREAGFQAEPAELAGLVNKEGVAKTTLRPSGIGLIGGKKYTVVTEGVFLPKDTPIKVIKVEGNQIVVREV